MIIRDYT